MLLAGRVVAVVVSSGGSEVVVAAADRSVARPVCVSACSPALTVEQNVSHAQPPPSPAVASSGIINR